MFIARFGPVITSFFECGRTSAPGNLEMMNTKRGPDHDTLAALRDLDARIDALGAAYGRARAKMRVRSFTGCQQRLRYPF